MEKKWLIKSRINPREVEQFRSSIKVSPTISELLLQRNINTYDKASHFFKPQLSELHDPFLMKNMEEAVNCLNKTIQHQDKVLLFGDYDVDGTSSVAVMHLFLKDYIKELDFYIPDRYEEGYGLSKKGIDYAKENDVKLMIVLDCGIKSIELISYGKSLGIEFIICDHHEPGDAVPNGIILDPKQSDCAYPYKELCGCGVGFKLLQALSHQNNWQLEKLYQLLDFVAVAIAADIVPITGENRILAHHGMRLMNEFPRKAFKKLFAVAKRSFPISLTDVVFVVAPRINAAGRMHSGMLAVQFMISEDDSFITDLVNEIDQYNTKRKEVEQKMVEEALSIIENEDWYQTSKSTVVYQSDWHKGVVGIVASRLIENHFKPTIVLSEIDGVLTGSARTINDFNIYEAISKCHSNLLQFGGHAHAAGLTLEKSKFDAFRTQFEELVKNSMDQTNQEPIEQVDLELTFDSIYEKNENRNLLPKFKRILSKMEPHGPKNMKPVFYSKNVYSKTIRVLKEKHLKLTVIQANSDVVLDAIAFNLSQKILDVAEGVPFEMIYTLESNRWNGKESLQLNVKDIRSMI